MTWKKWDFNPGESYLLSDIVAALVRAAYRAAEFIEPAENRVEVARILACPEYIGVDADVILRTLEGRLKVSPDGAIRAGCACRGV